METLDEIEYSVIKIGKMKSIYTNLNSATYLRSEHLVLIDSPICDNGC